MNIVISLHFTYLIVQLFRRSGSAHCEPVDCAKMSFSHCQKFSLKWSTFQPMHFLSNHLFFANVMLINIKYSSEVYCDVQCYK